MTTAKNYVFIGLQHENCYLFREGVLSFDRGENKHLVEGSLLGGGWFFQVDGNEQTLAGA